MQWYARFLGQQIQFVPSWKPEFAHIASANFEAWLDVVDSSTNVTEEQKKVRRRVGRYRAAQIYAGIAEHGLQKAMRRGSS